MSDSHSSHPGTETALVLSKVTVRRGGRVLLDELDWEVRAGERWVVLGPNGSGKTTLVRVASLHLHPTSGRVEVLGEELGRTDVRRLRRRIPVVSSAIAELLRPTIEVADVVMTARYAALEPWWHEYSDEDRDRANGILASLDIAQLADRTFGTLSSGERQRVLLARALFTEPGLVLLDEPMAGLDLGGREELVGALTDLAAEPSTPPIVLVTHHVDEIPPTFDKLLLLSGGRVVARGPLDRELTPQALSQCFGLDLTLERRGGRWQSWRATGPS